MLCNRLSILAKAESLSRSTCFITNNIPEFLFHIALSSFSNFLVIQVRAVRSEMGSLTRARQSGTWENFPT